MFDVSVRGAVNGVLPLWRILWSHHQKPWGVIWLNYGSWGHFACANTPQSCLEQMSLICFWLVVCHVFLVGFSFGHLPLGSLHPGLKVLPVLVYFRQYPLGEGWGDRRGVNVAAVMAALMMLWDVFSIIWCYSPWVIRCCLACLSLGFATFSYWLVVSIKSCITSSKFGIAFSMVFVSNKGAVGPRGSTVVFSWSLRASPWINLSDEPYFRLDLGGVCNWLNSTIPGLAPQLSLDRCWSGSPWLPGFSLAVASWESLLPHLPSVSPLVLGLWSSRSGRLGF